MEDSRDMHRTFYTDEEKGDHREIKNFVEEINT